MNMKQFEKALTEELYAGYDGDLVYKSSAAHEVAERNGLNVAWVYPGESVDPTVIYELADGYAVVTCSYVDLTVNGEGVTGSAVDFFHELNGE